RRDQQRPRGRRRPGAGHLARPDAASVARPFRHRSQTDGRRSRRMKDLSVAAPPVPLKRDTTTANRQNALGDYFALTKPRLNLLVVATSAAGYYLGATAP